MYKRKTIDVYHLMTNYGYGEESELIENTLEEAKEQKKCYLENATGLISIRIVRHRTIITQ